MCCQFQRSGIVSYSRKGSRVASCPEGRTPQPPLCGKRTGAKQQAGFGIGPLDIQRVHEMPSLFEFVHLEQGRVTDGFDSGGVWESRRETSSSPLANKGSNTCAKGMMSRIEACPGRQDFSDYAARQIGT